MFDVGFSEILLIAVVALVAIGPEDLPEMLFRFGRLMRQLKIFLGGIRDQYSDIMHEAEMQHYRRQLREEILGEKPPALEKMPEKPLENPAEEPPHAE